MRLLFILPLIVLIASPTMAGEETVRSFNPLHWIEEKLDRFLEQDRPDPAHPVLLRPRPAIIPNAVGSYLAGRYAQNQQDWVAALDHYGKSRNLGLTPSPEHDMQFMLLAVGAERFDKALDLAKQISARGDTLTPHEEQLLNLVLATGMVRDGREADALSLLEKTRKSALSVMMNPILTDWLRVAGGIKPKASGNGANLLRILHLAMVYEAEGNTKKAAETYSRVLDLQPNLRASFIVVAYYIRNDQIELATKLLEDMAAQEEPDLTAMTWLDQLKAGQTPNISAFSNHLTLAHGGYAAALQDFARLVYAEGGFDSAMIFARLAQIVAPQLQGLPLTIGNILDKKNQPERAYYILSNVASDDPDYLQASIRASDMLMAQNRTQEAAELLLNLTSDIQDARLLYAYAEILRSMEDYEAAIAVYNEIEQNYGLDTAQLWTVHYVRGISYDSLDRWPEAEQDFRMALEHSPENPHILNYLGYSLVDRGLNLEEALPMLEKAVQLAPQDGYIADSLAWALYKLGRYEEAKPHLEFAISLLPGDPVVNDHLGDLYWKLGRKTEAGFQWQRALGLSIPETDEEDMTRIRNKIETGLHE